MTAGRACREGVAAFLFFPPPFLPTEGPPFGKTASRPSRNGTLAGPGGAASIPPGDSPAPTASGVFPGTVSGWYRRNKMRELALAALLFLTTGCSFGGGGSEMEPVPMPILTAAPQPFRTQTTFVDGVLSIDVRLQNGETETLDTRQNRDYSWELYLPRPVQPNHRSREWLLAQNHYDGRIMVYALASWNNDNPDDYLAAGWWLIYPPGTPFWEFEDAARGVFMDGPEIDPMNPPDLPIDGTATYTGSSGGLYTYQYGRDWGEELKGTTEYTEFAGPLSLEADFSKKVITGCMGCIAPIQTAPGRHLFPAVPWYGPDPAALPAEYDVRFSAMFGTNGAFESRQVSVQHPERNITASVGTWRGQLSNVPDEDGNPRRVVGSTDIHFAEGDGSHGRFTGIFDALTPAALTP